MYHVVKYHLRDCELRNPQNKTVGLYVGRNAFAMALSAMQRLNAEAGLGA